MPLQISDPMFFESPAEWREWLREHHATSTEAWLGFYRKESGMPTMTWSDSVDEALCWGWIDGFLKKLDDIRFVRRFTPRRPKSVWSKVNLAKVDALIAAGRMQAPGLAVYERREEKRSGIYAFEQDKPRELDPTRAQALATTGRVFAFWKAQPPSYRRTVIYWVESAKRECTRELRFDHLLTACRQGIRLPQFTSAKSSPAKKK
jgi:uncharacterized protein YdeI (YjbR/CyaY-like superfamily)